MLDIQVMKISYRYQHVHQLTAYKLLPATPLNILF